MAISAIDETGNAVDWWFLYKLPRGAKSPKPGSKTKPSTGFEYLYLDSNSKKVLGLSNQTFLNPTSALNRTLSQLYGNKVGPGLGTVHYNDEIPDNPGSDDEAKGHTKGVLAYDTATDSAFWLLHSTPRYPLTTGPDFPDNEKQYGQTYLCVTLRNVETAGMIARQMIDQQEPQTYDCKIPAGIAKADPLFKVTQSIDVNDPAPPADIAFPSKGGTTFRLIAKNRHWNDDFWNDLVGPHLSLDLEVETWRRGVLAATADSDQKHHVDDVLAISLEPLNIDYAWSYTKDHAKWAVSEEDDWVCIADINRDKSQAKRGGGTICFQHKLLWQSLSEIALKTRLPGAAAGPAAKKKTTPAAKPAKSGKTR